MKTNFREVSMTRSRFERSPFGLAKYLLAVCGCLAAYAPGLASAAATVDTRVVWVEGQPQVELTVDTTLPDGLQELTAPLTLLDALNKPLWQTVVKLPVSGAGPWQIRVPLEKIEAPARQHHIELTLRSSALAIDYGAEIYFAAEAATVQTYGLAHEGDFPERKVTFLLGLNAFKGRELRDVPLSLTIREADDNVVVNRQAAVPAADVPRQHRIDVTPDTSSAIGPFTLEVGIDSESHAISYSTSLKFAQPNALVPISSLEADLGLWFASQGDPQQYRTLEMYYSPHLTDLLPRNHPLVSYDSAEKHTGRQSLKIEYQVDKPAYVWSRQELPGKPLGLSFWVKGNESSDELVVYFEDHINFTLPAWQRNANFSQATLCRLDFAGWRRFSVPVLGGGLQASGAKGSTANIDGPVKLLALGIKPGPVPKDAVPKDAVPKDAVPKDAPAAAPAAAAVARTVWLDDLAVETQVATADQLSMEFRASQADGNLTADGSLTVSVGNGRGAELRRGSVTLVVTDVDHKPVHASKIDLPVAAGGYAVAEIPLAEVAKRNPPGPIEVDATFADPSVAGARITRRIVLKNARQGGVFQDFEEPVTFNGYQPGKLAPAHAKIVPGGADGSAHALAVQVKPNEDDNSVLFHPALRGEVERIEMMVQGGEQPTTLQVWFIDSGATGIWIRAYNLFWAKPITVDWKGWRKVSIPAPPIPAHHGEKNHSFLYEPWYPLNLAFNLKLETGEQPVEIRVDNIRVVTHIRPEEELSAAVEFPDETHIHPAGAPLRVSLSNYGAADAQLTIAYKLHNYQGFEAQAGKLDLTLPAGARQPATLVESLAPGIYDLELTGVGKTPLKSCITVLDARQHFGEQPLTALTDLLGLRRSLGLTTEKMYFDWDNTEGAPYLFHYNWFEQDLKKRRDIPVLPPALEPAVARAAAAKAAALDAEKNTQALQAKLAPLKQMYDQAVAKLAASTKALEPLRIAAEAAVKKVQEAQAKAAAAANDAATPPQTLEQLKAELAAAEQALVVANKAVADAEAVMKTDEGALATQLKAWQDDIAAVEQAQNALQTVKADAIAAARSLDEAKLPYALEVVPVVGFSADWAGSEATDSIEKGNYSRWIPNMIQAPVRLADWSQFVRAAQREFKGRFDRWTFWENPDLDEAPQSLPPARYAAMLELFNRWVKLYNPQAKVIAGGFNFDKALGYLSRIPAAHKLPFDEIAIQMNLGELSPEHADMEGFLDELNDLLQIPQTKRMVGITELDWGIGEFLSPALQAAYHARAAMILDSRGVGAHQFNLLNTGFAFDGYGVFYRNSYGNTAELQTFEPYHIPKPSYFSMTATRAFLKDWKYVAAVALPGRTLADNRAFVYRDAAGHLTTAVWRAIDGQCLFKVPATWSGLAARDTFGFDVSLSQGLRCTPLPSLLRLPDGYALEQLLDDLRRLELADGSFPVVLDLYPAEPDSALRAKYQSAGQIAQVVHGGVVPGGRKIREPFVEGLESESFRFMLPQAGDVLLRRRWFFDGEGQTLRLQLNERAQLPWDLSKGQVGAPGVREAMFVLRDCPAGENRVTLQYDKPGNCAGYRLEPIRGDFVPLARWGAINTRQTAGSIQTDTSATGTPLAIGSTTYASGIGAHATSLVEYPLDGQFDKFEVTVGIDGSTEGRGSVIFRVYVDDKPRADSGVVNGFSKPQTLIVDGLAGARRMVLSVMDAGDGNRHDLANWADGKLYLRRQSK